MEESHHFLIELYIAKIGWDSMTTVRIIDIKLNEEHTNEVTCSILLNPNQIVAVSIPSNIGAKVIEN